MIRDWLFRTFIYTAWMLFVGVLLLDVMGLVADGGPWGIYALAILACGLFTLEIDTEAQND